MKLFNILLFTTTIVISIPAVLYTNDNPQRPFEEFKTAATEKMIKFKNTLDKHYEPIKPYVDNPIGLGSLCLLSAVVGIKPVAAALILGGITVVSREIIKHIEQMEKDSQKAIPTKNSSSSADKS